MAIDGQGHLNTGLSLFLNIDMETREELKELLTETGHNFVPRILGDMNAPTMSERTSAMIRIVKAMSELSSSFAVLVATSDGYPDDKPMQNLLHDIEQCHEQMESFCFLIIQNLMEKILKQTDFKTF